MLNKGDAVKWRFRNGETHGIIIKIHTKDFIFMNRQSRASESEPQYEVISEKQVKQPFTKLLHLRKYKKSHKNCGNYIGK